MGLFRSEHSIAHAKITKLDLDIIVKKAREELKDADAHLGENGEYIEQAVNEYRHFLWLLWWNRKEGNELPVVPTKRADTIRHAHLLFNAEYNAFCENTFGEIIIHRPGLEEGSGPFITAVLHTKALHDQVGYDGFDKNYFAYVETAKLNLKRKEDSSSQASAGCGGGTITKAPAADTGSSCGSSCGGGGCGGGCGG